MHPSVTYALKLHVLVYLFADCQRYKANTRSYTLQTGLVHLGATYTYTSHIWVHVLRPTKDVKLLPKKKPGPKEKKVYKKQACEKWRSIISYLLLFFSTSPLTLLLKNETNAPNNQRSCIKRLSDSRLLTLSSQNLGMVFWKTHSNKTFQFSPFFLLVVQQIRNWWAAPSIPTTGYSFWNSAVYFKPYGRGSGSGCGESQVWLGLNHTWERVLTGHDQSKAVSYNVYNY